MDINVNVKITLEETPALVNTLSAFTAVLQELHPGFEKTFGAKEQPAVSNTTVNPMPVQQQLVPPASVAPQPAIPVTAPAPQPAPAAVPTSAPKQYTLPEIQAACGPLMDAGKMNDLAAVMQSMGVASLMELPQDKYGELAVKLRALGAKL